MPVILIPIIKELKFGMGVSSDVSFGFIWQLLVQIWYQWLFKKVIYSYVWHLHIRMCQKFGQIRRKFAVGRYCMYKHFLKYEIEEKKYFFGFWKRDLFFIIYFSRYATPSILILSGWTFFVPTPSIYNFFLLISSSIPTN